jgi:hypothetical protein
MSVTRSSWGKFPPVIVHATLPALQGHAAYADASAGDFNAARLVAAELLKPEAITWRTDYIVPVLRLEAPERWNPLSLALAERLALLTGAELYTRIVQVTEPPPGPPEAIAHLLQQPRFEGPVPKGTCLLVDESVALGANFANLRGYLEANGAAVAAATSFTARLFASKLRPDAATLTSLQRRFGHEFSLVSETLGFPVDQLTHKETLVLNGLANLDVFRDPLAATHRIVRLAPGLVQA